jgi:glutamate---cysteine ligase / carboxylate-amine ligase
MGIARREPKKTNSRWHEGAPLPVADSSPWPETEPLTEAACRARFEEVSPFTLGIEEELMLVDPVTLNLSPSNGSVTSLFPEDGPYRRELRAAQIEIVTSVCSTAREACRELATARATLVDRLDGQLRLLSAGTHPTCSENDWGEVSDGARYQQLAGEYEWAARRTLVCGLHVHVAAGGAERSLAVYNALRSYIPIFAALAANSPYFEGRDTGLASIRPKLNEAFARAGIPPVFPDWLSYLELINWGRSGGLFPDASHFWWDLRLHPAYGTIELRAADVQTRVEDNAAIAALFQAIVIWLAKRFDAGEELTPDDHFRVHENHWRALRHGVSGWLVDYVTGEKIATRTYLVRLLDQLQGVISEYDLGDLLADIGVLIAGNGAERQRYVVAREGLAGLTPWLVRETEVTDAGS